MRRERWKYGHYTGGRGSVAARQVSHLTRAARAMRLADCPRRLSRFSDSLDRGDPRGLVAPSRQFALDPSSMLLASIDRPEPLEPRSTRGLLYDGREKRLGQREADNGRFDADRYCPQDPFGLAARVGFLGHGRRVPPSGSVIADRATSPTSGAARPRSRWWRWFP